MTPLIAAAKVNGKHRLAFFVRGKPVPKQSFRVAPHGGGYQPARVTAWQDDVAWTAREAMHAMHAAGLFAFTSQQIVVRLHFKLPNHRPMDLDNLSKGTLDACNGVLWADDRQIVDLHITKTVDSENPGVEVQVSEKPA